jgi:uncharacterized membrane protein YagU involved in acid resistance
LELLPSELSSPLLAFFLIIVAGFTSFITVAFGACEGLLLVILAFILLMPAVNPVNSLVILGLNANPMLLTLGILI